MFELNQKKMGLLIISFSLALIIFLGLINASASKKDEALCELYHSDPKLDVSQCPVHKSNENWLLMFSFIISAMILGGGLYMYLVPVNSKNQATMKDMDVSNLSEEENKIYSLLKDNKGSMYQSDLIRKTDFTKVQITRILDKMESDDILERRRRGMANIVVLK